MLPTDYNERKALPVYTFLVKYFPLAFLEVVRVAVAGDKQHLNNSQPGEIRWAREKSTDQLNTALRHIMDYGMGQAIDDDGRAHLAKAIWRLSAQLQLDEEARLDSRKPLTPHGEALAQRYVAAQEFGQRDMVDESGFPWGQAGPIRPPSICGDCGVDLEEQAHDAGCLRNGWKFT